MVELARLLVPDYRAADSAPDGEVLACGEGELDKLLQVGDAVLSRINAPLKFCDVPGSEPATRRLAGEYVAENFRAADALLKGRDFFFDHFTAVDAHFFWCVRRATQYNLPLDGYPNLLAHFERMKQRASVQKVLAFEKETEKALGWV